MCSISGLNEELVSSAQSVVNSLQVLEVLAPSLHPTLSTQLFSLLPQLLSSLCSQYTAIRHKAARCFATLAQVQLHHTMQVIDSDHTCIRYMYVQCLHVANPHCCVEVI